MGRNCLLAFGDFKRSERVDLETVAHDSGLELAILNEAGSANAWLAQNLPKLLVVDASANDAEGVCLGTRTQVEHANTPIVVAHRELDDLSFAEAFSWGGDDAVRLGEVRSAIARIRNLPKDVPVPVSNRRGVAVVADPDRARRLVRARVLRNAGYRIQFSVEASEAKRFAQDPATNLVLIDAELDGAVDTAQDCAGGRRDVLHVVLGAPRQLPMLSTALFGNDNCVIADGFAPAENVVFLANEYSRGGVNNKRASRRLLYGTMVAYRSEGRDVDDFGYAYNISEGGLYVRTLAPPEEDSVWLELQPPRSNRRVRLEGAIVWRRRFGPAENATVPPGFGVRIVDGSSKSMAAWRAGYAEFAAALGAN
jgi:hypothetical protein